MMFFDTHSHYCDNKFEADRDALLTHLLEKSCCGILTCPSDLTDTASSQLIAHSYDKVWFAAGIHPQVCSDFELSDLEKLRPFLEDEKCVAVGECGLDYYYDCAPKERQKAFFSAQCELAKEYNKPIIVHDRDAHADTLSILSRHHPKAILHCYSGSLELAKQLVQLDCYISFAGTLTFKNAVKLPPVAAWVPEDRLLIETDCPYLAPEPMRGRRNDSSLIRYTAEKLAEIRGCDLQHIEKITTENSKKVLGL